MDRRLTVNYLRLASYALARGTEVVGGTLALVGHLCSASRTHSYKLNLHGIRKLRYRQAPALDLMKQRTCDAQATTSKRMNMNFR